MNSDISRIPVTDARYPEELREAPGCPGELFLRGELPAPRAPRIAIVGTRKATSDGKATAHAIARDLARAGVVVVSGLALGIDAAAHEGALDGDGTTVAVLGNGLDTVYPAQHEQLARRIREGGGCLLSEYPPGTPAYPANFLARNRIVSGLSLAVVIVEAPLRSGTLVTAKFALEQGREVFVLPGPANHPNFMGSHRLIREGARLVSSAADVLEDLSLASGGESPGAPPEGNDDITDDERAIVEYLARSKQPRLADEVATGSGLSGQAAAAALSMLAVRGRVVESKRGFVLR